MQTSAHHPSFDLGTLQSSQCMLRVTCGLFLYRFWCW